MRPVGEQRYIKQPILLLLYCVCVRVCVSVGVITCVFECVVLCMFECEYVSIRVFWFVYLCLCDIVGLCFYRLCSFYIQSF